MKLRSLIFLVLLAGGALAAWFWFRSVDSDEARIRKTIQLLADSLSKTSGESAANALVKVKNISDSFADPASVTMGEYASGSFNHEAVLARAGQYRTLIEHAAVAVSDIQVRITGPAKAECYFSGKFSGSTKSGLGHEEVNDLFAVMVKQDNRWKIQDIRFQKVLH